MNTKFFTGALAVLILSLTLNADEPSIKAFTPDHYLSYRITNFYEQSFKVFLRDQFISGMFYVQRPIRLLNPSDKLHILPDGSVNEAKRNNARLHYLAYEIYWENATPVTKSVHIKNQFEEADLNVVTYPDRLLVPAAKKQYAWQPPVPELPIGSNPGTDTDSDEDIKAANAIILPIPDGSHYICYYVEQLDIAAVLAVFRDQFWSTEFNTFKRTHLCNPAVKRHDGKVWETDINDQDNHLVCYDVDTTNILRKVLTRDQFGARNSYVFLHDEVCVPTTKTDIVPEIACGDVNVDGECPVSTACGENTVCSPVFDGTPRCVCK